MYLICNGRLITHDSAHPYYENGAAAVDGGRIIRVGENGVMMRLYPEAELIDAKGGVIMPGLINAHTHFYSGMLRGFAMPGYSPSSLYDVLKGRSWKLDHELDFYNCIHAAYGALIESARCGVTTVFDHHASSSDPTGTLFGIACAVNRVGIRACLSYEVSMRCGYDSCSAGMHENAEFYSICERERMDRVRPIFGLHAPFTLSNVELAECVKLNNGRACFHIHVSESMDDTLFCQHNYGKRPINRLAEFGILGPDTIAAHCVHVTDEEMDILKKTGTFVVNCPQSNMSNAVGTAPVAEMLKRGITVGMGTDGFTSDMLESARAFITAQRQALRKPGFGVPEAARMLFENNRLLASRYFDSGIGTLAEGAPADVIIMDYTPFTPMDESNYPSHILFGMSGRDCSMCMVGGNILMKDRRLLTIDESAAKEAAARSAAELWARLKDRDDSEYEWSSPAPLFQ